MPKVKKTFNCNKGYCYFKVIKRTLYKILRDEKNH